MKKTFQKLTALQNKVGYVKGEINVIALLGLFGEAGEVLDETIISIEKADFLRRVAVSASKQIDNLKKVIRDKEETITATVFLCSAREEAFDEEMADTLYYLNALAINRGKTLADYAELSYQKVLKKSQQDISHGTVNKETVLP